MPNFWDAKEPLLIRLDAKTGAYSPFTNDLPFPLPLRVVLKEENMRSLRQNGLIVFLERDLAELSMEGRPLSKSMDDLKRIYEDRIELYRGYADMSFLNEEPPARVAERIREFTLLWYSPTQWCIALPSAIISATLSITLI